MKRFTKCVRSEEHESQLKSDVNPSVMQRPPIRVSGDPRPVAPYTYRFPRQAEKFYCPVANCERTSRPFPREYNMYDHIARVHKVLNPESFMNKTRRPRTARHPFGVASTLQGPVRVGDGVRKKTSRFEIPLERKLQNIDDLITNCRDSEELRELKQQKRFLRSRQAAYVHISW
jgi:hypothetical protein